MPIPIAITKEEIKAISKHLRNSVEFICGSPDVYLKALLVGQRMLADGKPLNAKIIKGYSDEVAA